MNSTILFCILALFAELAKAEVQSLLQEYTYNEEYGVMGG
jgi:hypothetical protein